MSHDEIYLGVIEPYCTEPDEIEHSLFEYDEVESDSFRSARSQEV
jgi:hypothetical protein